ncbi:F0F1 ATP synthase subunit delta [Fontimonas sp. SYSU GA230001]|uniref:F0F1 ATP synthase subunit delta n=1 Tax=Fontimonas sp. SYSU GA230001 TaxID=3142450 RepID=UPI0032B4C934
MQIDTTTFVLEIVNFLILLWLLRRFLFAPVRAAIDRRQAAVAATLAEARQQAEAAAELKMQYEARMKDWDREREARRAQLDAELAAERDRQLASLRAALDTEREKQRAVQERREQEQHRALEARAADQGLRLAARVLERLSGPELDARIAAALVEDLDTLDVEQKVRLIEAAKSGAELDICSAHPLPDASYAQLRDALGAHLGTRAHATRRVDPQLIGGLRIALGPWLLQASLADELAYFRSSSPDAA